MQRLISILNILKKPLDNQEAFLVVFNFFLNDKFNLFTRLRNSGINRRRYADGLVINKLLSGSVSVLISFKIKYNFNFSF